MADNLKVLFVKQLHDNVGPKMSYSYDESISPIDVLQHFNGKTSLFETLLYYKSDFVIIPTRIMSPWLNTMLSFNGYQEFLESSTTGVIEPTSFDFGKYDVVISHDPILHPYIVELKEKFKNTVFAFNLVEHSSWQMHQLGYEYDLFLDHTLNSTWEFVRLPQAINYVFPRVPYEVQGMFDFSKESIFIDYRSYGHFLQGNNNASITKSQIDDFNSRISINLPIEEISETSLKPYMFTTDSSDSIEFYKKLSRSKYFITISNRVGQAAFDAASMGCLVIGNNQSTLHQLLCHRDCLVKDDFTIDDVIMLIERIESDDFYYKTMLDAQSINLKKYGVDYAKDMFTKAVKLKRSKI